MKKSWTVQCGYTAHFANTLTVEAETLEEALEKAIETANADDAWRSTGRLSGTFVDAVCEGASADPRDTDAAWPVPDRFTERGEPPVVTLTDPGRPGGGAKACIAEAQIRPTPGMLIRRLASSSSRGVAPPAPRRFLRWPRRPIPRPAMLSGGRPQGRTSPSAKPRSRGSTRSCIAPAT